MKIEKLNENQLKFTLAPEDLTVRGLILSELAYGSEKTNELYNELLNKALVEFGFQNEDSAVMIEAIPTSSGSLILIVTRNHPNDDLDARFSSFSPDRGKHAVLEEPDNDFIPLPDIIKNKTSAPEPEVNNSNPISRESNIKIYSCSSLEVIIELAARVKDIFIGKSSVYKNTKNNQYFLILEKAPSDKSNFGKVCTVASEYTTPVRTNYATVSVLKEHYEKIIDSDAIEVLSVL